MKSLTILLILILVLQGCAWTARHKKELIIGAAMVGAAIVAANQIEDKPTGDEYKP